MLRPSRDIFLRTVAAGVICGAAIGVLFGILLNLGIGSLAGLYWGAALGIVDGVLVGLLAAYLSRFDCPLPLLGVAAGAVTAVVCWAVFAALRLPLDTILIYPVAVAVVAASIAVPYAASVPPDSASPVPSPPRRHESSTP